MQTAAKLNGGHLSPMGNNLPPSIFDNQKGWMRPEEVASLLSISVKTIYDWKYRARKRHIPDGLFIKFNRQLFIRTDILRTWVISQNPDLQSGF